MFRHSIDVASAIIPLILQYPHGHSRFKLKMLPLGPVHYIEAWRMRADIYQPAEPFRRRLIIGRTERVTRWKPASRRGPSGDRSAGRDGRIGFYSAGKARIGAGRGGGAAVGADDVRDGRDPAQRRGGRTSSAPACRRTRSPPLTSAGRCQPEQRELQPHDKQVMHQVHAEGVRLQAVEQPRCATRAEPHRSGEHEKAARKAGQDEAQPGGDAASASGAAPASAHGSG